MVCSQGEQHQTGAGVEDLDQHALPREAQQETNCRPGFPAHPGPNVAHTRTRHLELLGVAPRMPYRCDDRTGPRAGTVCRMALRGVAGLCPFASGRVRPFLGWRVYRGSPLSLFRRDLVFGVRLGQALTTPTTDIAAFSQTPAAGLPVRPCCGGILAGSDGAADVAVPADGGFGAGAMDRADRSPQRRPVLCPCAGWEQRGVGTSGVRLGAPVPLDVRGRVGGPTPNSRVSLSRTRDLRSSAGRSPRRRAAAPSSTPTSTPRRPAASCCPLRRRGTARSERVPGEPGRAPERLRVQHGHALDRGAHCEPLDGGPPAPTSSHRLLVYWIYDRSPARLGRGDRRDRSFGCPPRFGVALIWHAPCRSPRRGEAPEGCAQLEVALPSSPTVPV